MGELAVGQLVEPPPPPPPPTSRPPPPPPPLTRAAGCRPGDAACAIKLLRGQLSFTGVGDGGCTSTDADCIREYSGWLASLQVRKFFGPHLRKTSAADRTRVARPSWLIYDCTGPRVSEKDAELAQKLGQLQPFTCIAVFPQESIWANLYLLGQPNTVLAPAHRHALRGPPLARGRARRGDPARAPPHRLLDHERCRGPSLLSSEKFGPTEFGPTAAFYSCVPGSHRSAWAY